MNEYRLLRTYTKDLETVEVDGVIVEATRHNEDGSWDVYNAKGQTHHEPSLPFVAGSETSHAAAVSVASVAGRDRARVYDAIRDAEDGLCDHEIALVLSLNPSTARPRRIELVSMGLVVDSTRKRLTKSGRRAVVWVAK